MLEKIKKLWYRATLFYFYAWRDAVSKAMEGKNPLLVYPFLVWLNFSAENVYLQGGLDAVNKAANETLDAIGKAYVNAFGQMAKE